MKKNIRKITIIVFLGFIFSFTILNIFSKDQQFSENENRYLATRPVISSKLLLSGKFDETFDNYINDQFIFRDQWIMIKALFQKFTLHISNNNVYFADDHKLIGQTLSYDKKQIDKNIEYINEFVNRYPNTNMVLVPQASAIEKDSLPFLSYNIDEIKLINDIYDKLNTNNVDVVSYLIDTNDSYFKSDHHYNEKGAYLTYTAICDQVLDEEPLIFNYELKSEEFKGTLNAKSGLYYYPADNIYEIISDKQLNVQIEYDNDGIIHDSIYNEDNLDIKDKYTYYLDGNHSIYHIKTENNNKRNAVIIKDSFAHILLPYLLYEYDNITMVDLRYYHQPLNDLINDNDDIYLIYSIENFISDNNLVFLKE